MNIPRFVSTSPTSGSLKEQIQLYQQDELGIFFYEPIYPNSNHLIWASFTNYSRGFKTGDQQVQTITTLSLITTILSISGLFESFTDLFNMLYKDVLPNFTCTPHVSLISKLATTYPSSSRNRPQKMPFHPPTSNSRLYDLFTFNKKIIIIYKLHLTHSPPSPQVKP
ncbi:hypothetical protein CIPAW_09G029100 [Carya illinoinensis]|uniref:Uncharacterized protein n=1 Tax=Carya illinoinensis TaxID=32201 RepID=A0A8T1PJZ2_CARIL|nr:hypothetical protein CIPAW_09G029100 [Carya illinoinensis]